jgi:hypothetical protein
MPGRPREAWTCRNPEDGRVQTSVSELTPTLELIELLEAGGKALEPRGTGLEGAMSTCLIRGGLCWPSSWVAVSHGL